METPNKDVKVATRKKFSNEMAGRVTAIYFTQEASRPDRTGNRKWTTWTPFFTPSLSR